MRKAKTCSSPLCNTWVILLGLLLVLSGAYYYVSQEKHSIVDEYTLPAFTNVHSITVQKGESILFLEKSDENWIVKNNTQEYPLGKKTIKEILTTLQGIKRPDLVSTNEKNQSDIYGIKPENNIDLIIAQTGKAEPFSLIIGNENKETETTYISIGDSRTFVVPYTLRTLFDKSLADFREKNILAFDARELEKVSLFDTANEKAFVLERVNDKWQNTLLNEEVSLASMYAYIENLQNFSISEFIPYPQNLAEYGLLEGAYPLTLSLEGQNMENITILVGKKDNKIYLQKLGNTEEIYEVAEYMLSDLQGSILEIDEKVGNPLLQQ